MSIATATATHTAVIPAKEHSSRCPGKNWRTFAAGGSLTDWAVASVPEDMFAGIIVSTDRAEFSPTRPCEVHHRNAASATVEADVQDLLKDIIRQYRLHDSYVWLLNPTSPFRDRRDFEAISSLIERTGCPAVVSVTPVSPFLWHGDRALFDTAGRRPNTQDSSPSHFAENGMFYVFRGQDFLEHGTWYVSGVQRYVQRGLSKTVDVDTEDEFREAAAIWAALRPSDDAEPWGAAAPDGLDGTAQETLAVESLVRPPLARHLTLLGNHIRRYVLAAESLHISGHHRVLDASCGKGYGSHLLASSAGQVVGLDVNPTYLEVANREFAGDNLRFMAYDAYFAEARPSADKIVCIETYEHLPHHQQGPFVSRLLTALRPGGDVFMTAPLGNDAGSTVNPFHLHEPSLGVLHDVLSPRFREVSYRTARRLDSFGQDSHYCCVTLLGYRGA